MAKAGIHPEWYPESKVYCNGELVMTVGATQPEIHVDIWSGNHPFFTGTQKIIDTEGRVERFLRKYGMMEGAPDTVSTGKTEADKPEGIKIQGAAKKADAAAKKAKKKK
jgi:large subunit ribosomal protein L31